MKIQFQPQTDKVLKVREDLYFHLRASNDGSLTCFSSSSAEESNESMHSLEGAFTETEYIYGEAIENALLNQLAPVFLNLGLGIAYNEISILSHCIKNNIPKELIHIHSYEFYPDLEKAIKDFFLEDKESFFSPVYQESMRRNAELFSIHSDSIKELAVYLLQNSQWKLLGAMSTHTEISMKASVLLFDAYSKQTSPDLWNEELLKKILGSMNEKSIVSTYAATGDLNRNLQALGFQKIPRKGFAYKRESTFAIRDLQKSQIRFSAN